MLLRFGTRRSLAMVGGLLVALALLVGGCSGGGGGDTPSVSVSSSGGSSQEPVGNANCLQCHTSFPSDMFTAGDPVETRAPYTDAGTGIGVAYQESVHNQPTFSPTSSNYVKCEDCHGNGRQHFGVGPIPKWAPQTDQCGVCHKTPHFDLASFQATKHYNADNSPDAAFSQGGTGTDPASSRGRMMYKADGVTPVSKNEYIEECSACHSYAQSMRPSHIANGNLNKTEVGCSSCHDSHSPVLRNRPVLQDGTTAPADQMLRFKPVRVNNDPANAQFGALNLVAGTWIRPTLHFIYNTTGLTQDPAYAQQATTQGDLLRLSSERACVACHQKGTFKYIRFRQNLTTGAKDPYTTNHAPNTFAQFNNSGHADKTQLAFEEFSLMAAIGSSHRPIYPVDMGKTTPAQGQNNFQCNQCHHGIGAIDWLTGASGSKTYADEATAGSAHILWGDSTVTCITCHDPHKDQSADGLNVRVPKYLSYNTYFNDTNNPGAGNKRGGLNKFMDGTAIPAGVGNSIICLDCHQGRESGYTIHRRMQTFTPTAANYYTQTTGNLVGKSYSNAHYFSGGADLWSKNAFEFYFPTTPGDVNTMAPMQYSNGIPEHQAQNCTGCHMSNPKTDNTAGGHTWKPNITTCQSCHAGIPTFESVAAPQNVDGDASTITVHEKFGVIDGTVAPAITDKGLFNILRYSLYTNADTAKRVWYDPASYPYFFKVNADGTKNAGSYTNWDINQFVAAFNLGKLYKAGSAVYVHNYYYDAQILIDSLRAIGRTTNPNTATAFVRPTTPAGGTLRNATDYRTIVVP